MIVLTILYICNERYNEMQRYILSFSPNWLATVLLLTVFYIEKEQLPGIA